jgi:hypothetical protein
MIYIKKTDRSCFEMYAYYQEEACRDEVQFVWYLDL